MHFADISPEDLPDPREESRARLAAAPFTQVGFVDQPALEHHGNFSWEWENGHRAPVRESVTATYTLLRNPAWRDDPANFAVLDAGARAALESVPPWPRPAWMVEAVERMRYRQLWEAVRTSWAGEPDERDTVEAVLLRHANHVLMNHFRTELGLRDGLIEDWSWAVRPAAVNSADVSIELDGRRVPASEIDTDPFVYAVGVRVDSNTVVTVVIAREELPYLRVALASAARQD